MANVEIKTVLILSKEEKESITKTVLCLKEIYAQMKEEKIDDLVVNNSWFSDDDVFYCKDVLESIVALSEENKKK